MKKHKLLITTVILIAAIIVLCSLIAVKYYSKGPLWSYEHFIKTDFTRLVDRGASGWSDSLAGNVYLGSGVKGVNETRKSGEGPYEISVWLNLVSPKAATIYIKKVDLIDIDGVVLVDLSSHFNDKITIEPSPTSDRYGAYGEKILRTGHVYDHQNFVQDDYLELRFFIEVTVMDGVYNKTVSQYYILDAKSAWLDLPSR